MNYAYIRVSTKNQNYCPQIDAIFSKYKNIDRIFIDCDSGFKKDRKGLSDMISLLKKEDTIVTLSLDRLGRSFIVIDHIIQEIENAGSYLIAINEEINTKENPNKEFIKKISFYSEVEVGKIKERTSLGRNYAKKNGIKFGRKPKIINNNVVELYNQGLSYKSIADKIGVSRSTVYRFLKKEGLIKSYFENN